MRLLEKSHQNRSARLEENYCTFNVRHIRLAPELPEWLPLLLLVFRDPELPPRPLLLLLLLILSDLLAHRLLLVLLWPGGKRSERPPSTLLLLLLCRASLLRAVVAVRALVTLTPKYTNSLGDVGNHQVLPGALGLAVFVRAVDAVAVGTVRAAGATM